MVDSGDRPRISLWWFVVLFGVATVVALGVRVDDRSDRVGAVAPGATTATTALPTGVTLAFTGEILPHPSLVEHARRAGAATGSAYDFAPMFSSLAPTLQAADLAVCHLEVPVAPSGTELSGYPDFAVPPEVASGISAAGWDRCSTASNHANDQGSAGIAATLDALDAAGVGHSGTARTAEEAATVPLVDLGGVRVAHLSYTWGFNGATPREPWMANVIDPARIEADAAAARAAGAGLVVVSLHWGNEYDGVGSSDQRALADRLLASADIDLLVGHGPHVLQPIEQYHGKYVLLSVGNLAANQGAERPATYDGMIALVHFDQASDGHWVAAAPQVKPTWYDRSTGTVRVVAAALADPAVNEPAAAATKAALTGSWMRTAALMPGSVTPSP